MKTILLILTMTLCVKVPAQVLLNEIYTDPANGNHEFFELYNTSTSTLPENLDNYTLVSYYEESGKAGFYVFDLPSQSVTAHGYWVAAASLVFNVQSQTGLIANTNWNMVPATGLLTKWESNSGAYVQKPIPAGGVTDLFYRRNGSGASFHIFIYKDGVLVNALIAGVLVNVIPNYIKAMPPLFVNMIGFSPDFTINFNAINDNQAEYVVPMTGSDNGYMRQSDGKCGSWDKSSSSSEHTPGYTNGSATGLEGSLTITANLTYGAVITAPSYLNYNVTAGASFLFPVTMEAYRDKYPYGLLDPTDILFDTRVLQNTSAGVQTIQLVNRYDQVLLVAKTASGCYDRILQLQNYSAILPIHLLSFNCTLVNNKAELDWQIESAPNNAQFIVERSIDGSAFMDAGVVFIEENEAVANYNFTDNLFTINARVIYYRLRIVKAQGMVEYSEVRKILLNREDDKRVIAAYPNPSSGDTKISLPSAWLSKKMNAELYHISGKRVLQTHFSGTQLVEMLNLRGLSPGVYILKINCEGESAQQKIVINN